MDVNFDGPSGTIRIVAALLVGLGTMGYGAYSYTAQSSALASPETVDATIESTSVETIDKRHGTAYAPQASFEYSYQGDSYTSSNVYPGPLSKDFGSKADAMAQLDGYETGDTVTAYIPSDSPGNAFLKHERSNKPLFVIGFGGILTVGTLLSVFRS
ncbi:DUF3592 domain-containing protein [Halohasta salina]|uniref:DUF3592 domain-containing protein n=1 Tax=Halohasta salina TaxID=2961621 RepID=UPI0020A3013A|nr:DUF3592 domain-containing protein [Halohasta salina]